MSAKPISWSSIECASAFHTACSTAASSTAPMTARLTEDDETLTEAASTSDGRLDGLAPDGVQPLGRLAQSRDRPALVPLDVRQPGRLDQRDHTR